MDPPLPHELVMQPLTVFAVCYLVASVGAVGSFAKTRRDAKEHLTCGDVLTAVFYYGSAGTAFAMCGFDYLGGRTSPWKVIGASWGVGLGFIKIAALPGYMRKFLVSMEPKNGSDN